MRLLFLAAVPFRFPLSIVPFRFVPFYPVSLRFAAFRVFILGRQVYTLFQLETLRERCLTPSTCDAEHLFCTLEG